MRPLQPHPTRVRERGGGHILPPLLPYRVMIFLNLKTTILLRMKFIFPIQGAGAEFNPTSPSYDGSSQKSGNEGNVSKDDEDPNYILNTL